MNQSRLVRNLAALSPRDKERFQQFVHSPYFNQHEKTVELLEVIYQAFEKDSPELLDKKAVFRRLFPDQAYEEQPVHNLMSYLKKLYHRFLAVEHAGQEPYTEQLLTMENAYDRHQFDLLLNRAGQLKKKLKKSGRRDKTFHFAQYKLNHLIGYYETIFVDRNNPDVLQRMMDHLDRYYIVEKLRNSCHLTANQLILNTEFDFSFLDELLAHLQAHWSSYEQELSIKMYFHILFMLREEGDTQHYSMLKSILTEQSDGLSQAEVHDLYHFCYNFCIRQINLGVAAYQWELFELYQKGLDSRVLFESGLLHEWDFKNIVTLGCGLKQFEWTENFIETYRDFLPETSRDNAYRYNLAMLHFSKEDYDKALQELLHVQFTDVNYHLSTNFLLLRTYYALKDTEALLSRIDTLRIYIMRTKKLTTEKKRSYTNFLRFARKLVLVKHQAHTLSKDELKSKLHALSKQVESTELVMFRNWIIQECAPQVDSRSAAV